MIQCPNHPDVWMCKLCYYNQENGKLRRHPIDWYICPKCKLPMKVTTTIKQVKFK